MTDPLQDPRSPAQQLPAKAVKVRVRSIGWLWFFLVVVLALAGLACAAVYFQHQEFVRVYGALDTKAAEISGRLDDIEHDLRAAKKDDSSLAADIKELKLKQSDFQKEAQARAQEWQEMGKATLAYQQNLQAVLDEIRKKKDLSAAAPAPQAGNSTGLGVILVEKKSE